jgi:hypothetical protein
MARIQSAKEGMKPRSSLTCCSPTQRVGITLERRAEHCLQHENTLGVMPQRAVPEISGDRFRLVEPAVQRQVVED